VSYRKDQGRYARMFAFWALVLLFAYGCFHDGGLAFLLDGWLGAANATYVESFPILKSLKLSTVIALGVLTALAFMVHRVLNRPRLADTLIQTEEELQKVTWPTWGEAWHGSMAVAVMVLILFVFLTLADMSILRVMTALLGGSDGS